MKNLSIIIELIILIVFLIHKKNLSKEMKKLHQEIEKVDTDVLKNLQKKE